MRKQQAVELARECLELLAGDEVDQALALLAPVLEAKTPF